MRHQGSAVAGEQDERGQVVVIGAGPAGVRLVRDLMRLAPQRAVVLFGAEACEPYDRVRLSSVLAGECSVQSLSESSRLSSDPRLTQYLGDAVLRIDRASKTVITRSGRHIGYAQLVLAIGSRPHVPDIPGTQLPGVYQFRDLRDAERLSARRARSRRTVVLGGGLLGLEAARAMRRHHTEVQVVEHSGRLMPRQLDETASQLLEAQIREQGIEVIVDNGAAALLGSDAVSGVRLRNGRVIDADTVIIATGIIPNTRLALEAGLPIGRGIKVDDQLRTIDRDIFAIGECAEHRGQVYGLAAPCLEQAAVVASVLAGLNARYVGSVDATRLKVMKTAVFAAGLHPERGIQGRHQTLTYQDVAAGEYRQLMHQHGRLCGLLGVGNWSELPRALEAVQNQRRLSWLQRWRFARDGRLWSEAGASTVAEWPAAATVCNCTGVNRGQLSKAISGGCSTRAALAGATRASTVCGSCVPLLDELLGAPATVQATAGARSLLTMSLIAAVAVALLMLLPGLPYRSSWQAANLSLDLPWDRLWRDGLIKQISGFGLTGLAALGLLLSLRKRLAWMQVGSFALWRGLHVALGLAALLGLLAHTGGRIGNGLNAALLLCFAGVIAAGAGAGGLIAVEHRLAASQAKRARGGLSWLHLLACWPLPVLLGFHVLASYYF